MKFVQTNGCNHDFIELCHDLDSFLNEIVGGEQNRAEYIPYNSLDDIHDVIVVYDGDLPVGCAGFKKYDAECAEVKRVEPLVSAMALYKKIGYEIIPNYCQYKDMPDSICMRKKLQINEYTIAHKYY